MQDDYPADEGTRPGFVCGRGQVEARSARLFLCRDCRVQVIVCGCCDRGQIYCRTGCAPRARRRSLLAAGQRYQASPAGRRAHAARQGRYRAHHQIVTHQGSPRSAAGDLLAPDATIPAPDDSFSPGQARPPAPRCHWCGRPCLPWLRQEFLRRRRRCRFRVGHNRTGLAGHGDTA